MRQSHHTFTHKSVCQGVFSYDVSQRYLDVDVRPSSSTYCKLACIAIKTDNFRSTTSSPLVRYVTCQIIAMCVSACERANLTTMTTIHATASVFRTPSHTCAGDTTAADRLNMRGMRSGVLLTQICLTAVYSIPPLAVLASKMTNFSDLAVQQKDFSAYAFALGAGLWTLDSGPTDETFSTAALQSFWHVTNGIYMYVCFAASASCSHVHQSALPVGSMLQLLILSWTSSEGVVLTGGRYGSVPTGAFSRVVISALRFGLTCPFGRSTPLRAQPFLSP
jgi:hypothetical protein